MILQNWLVGLSGFGRILGRRFLGIRRRNRLSSRTGSKTVSRRPVEIRTVESFENRVLLTAVGFPTPEVEFTTSEDLAGVVENTTTVATIMATTDQPGSVYYSIDAGLDGAKFDIDGVTGELRFLAAPDFETPGDVGIDNNYQVTIRAEDDWGGFAVKTFNVDVTGINDNTPKFTSPVGSTASVVENSTSVLTVTATDADAGDVVHYSLGGGADAANFVIDPNTGELSFAVPPDFESHADSNGDNIYLVRVVASDGSRSARKLISVEVTNADEFPVAVNDAVTVAEDSGSTDGNLAGNDTPSGDGGNVWSLTTPASGGSVVVNGNGTFSYTPYANFSGLDSFTYTITDIDGDISTATVNITVTNVNDNPVITSGASFNVAENSTAVTTVTANDIDLQPPTLTYSLTGNGADADRFSMSPSGVLTFNTAPNFEVREDSDTNNTYVVEVAVSDGDGGTAVKTITVTVTDVNDIAPEITTTPSQSVAENVTIVAALTSTDADTVGTIPATFTVTGGADQTLFEVSAGNLVFLSGRDFETQAHTYVVQVSAYDGVFTTNKTITVTLTAVNDIDPMFTSGASKTVAENVAFSTTVTATDADIYTPNPADTLTFSLAGGDDVGLFSITSGGLLTMSAKDYEVPVDADHNNVYLVTVDVFDGFHHVTQNISVSVTNANDSFPIFTSTATPSVDENSPLSFDVTAPDADGDTVTYSKTGGGTDQALFEITPGGLLTMTAKNYEMPADSNTNNTYVVVVDAFDGLNHTQQTITVTVNPKNDNAPVFTSASGTLDIPLDVAETTTAVTTTTATDADLPAQVVVFSITGGADKDFFNISTSGVLTFKNPPDYETINDANGDHIYEVNVTASDNQGDASLTTVQQLFIRVVNVLEADAYGFDFQTPDSEGASPTQTAINHISVTASTTPYVGATLLGAYSGYGWVSGTATGFDRGTLNPGTPTTTPDLSNLMREANTGTGAGVFQANLLPNTAYDVTWIFGDKTTAHDQMNLTVVSGGSITGGTTPTNQSNAIGVFKDVHFTITTDATGLLKLQFADGGGSDANWVVSALEFIKHTYVQSHPLSITVNAPSGTTADASATDTISVTGYTPGATYSVVTTLGSSASDTDTRLVSSQLVAPASGTWTITIRRPYLSNVDGTTTTGTVTVQEVTGRSSGQATISYDATTLTRSFDFNAITDAVAGTSSSTASGYTPILPTDLYNTATGYGWTATATGNYAPNAGLANPNRDQDYHSGTTADTFQLRINKPTTPVSYTITIRSYNPSALAAISMKVKAESGAFTTYTVANQTLGGTSLVILSSAISADGILDLTFDKGTSGAGVVAKWQVSSIDVAITQLSATQRLGDAKNATSVSSEQLQNIADAAIARFAAAGASASTLAVLRDVEFQIKDLGGPSYLGITTTSHSVSIDDDGAGYGWFIDSTPLDNKEFKNKGGKLTGIGKAKKQMDLLSVVMHEFTNILKLNDQPVPGALSDAENISLGLGQRWESPTVSALDNVFAGDDLSDELLHGHRVKKHRK